MFQFKQFAVDQSGCAMKINTDGVLLGSIIEAEKPGSILDIGTGTGVIALMLAQRFVNATVHAVEIDETAAKTANSNFELSPFAERMVLYTDSFEAYFRDRPHISYDLIVSNPPFYTGSLKPPEERRALAKHSDFKFIESLTYQASGHLTNTGSLWLILPVELINMVTALARSLSLFVYREIFISSFPGSAAHRVIIQTGFKGVKSEQSKFVIYNAPGSYTDAYKTLLGPYFLAF